MSICRGQAYLTGPTLYLRPVEPEDAAAAIWRSDPFPVPAEVVQDQLKTMLAVDPDDDEAELLLLVSTRTGDRPVGSVSLRIHGERFGRIEPAIDALLPAEQRAGILAEVTSMLVPWLLDERNLMTVVMHVAGNHEVLDHQVKALGGRTAYRLRELFLVDGRQVDCLVYQFLNSRWTDRLGTPPEPDLEHCSSHGSIHVRSGCVLTSGVRPEDAVLVGERIYLRAFRPEEGALVARWALEEPQIYRPGGRAPVSAYAYGEFHNRLARQEPPHWARLAIVERNTGELLGCAGLDMISWIHRCATAEVVYFRPEHRGAGFARESSMLMLEYGFGTLGLHSIHAFVSEVNARSLASIRKRGYRDCGYLAWRSLCADGLCGVHVFDMLASEWRAAREALRTSAIS